VYANQTASTSVAEDPVLHLIEWHSGAKSSRPSDPTPSLDDEVAVEAALMEWHTNAGR
jgi:hypothetical protein